MAECIACGASVSPGEHFCGSCGTQQIPSSSEFKTVAASLSEGVEVHAVNAPPDEPKSQDAAPENSQAAIIGTGEPPPISSASLGGRSEERRVGKECRCRWALYH